MVRALIVLIALALVAGCGSDDEAAAPTETTTAPSLTADGRVFWLLDGKVWSAARELDTPGVAGSAVEALFAGPTAQEQADLHFETAIPADTEAPEVTLEEGVATVDSVTELSTEARAQLVYTLTQFSSVGSVEIEGRTYTRSDFEEQTPSVLVESPLPFEEVTSPLRVTGTANTFEATFNYELTDTDGRIVDENFVTATSGTGMRGTFDFTTGEYEIPFDGIGALIVFELSAEDGSRIHLVEIPLRMSQ